MSRGVVGAKAGAYVEGAIGSSFWGAGALPGAIIGGIVGGVPGAVIGGAVFSIAGSFGLSWLGTGYIDSLYGK